MNAGSGPRVRRFLAGPGLIGLAAALAWPVLAQDEEPAPDSIVLEAEAPPSPRPTPARVVESIVVTAGRREDLLESTPVSVSVTSELALRQTDITDIEALSDRLPNGQIAVTPTNTFFFVRGLGTGSVRSAEQSVGFFVDNVFLGRPQVALFDFLDLQQVELLRGPQGALLGKNTVAGAINLQTAAVSEGHEGYVELLGGSDGRRRGRFAWSGPLSDDLGARVAYSDVAEDGSLVNTTQQRLDLARPGRGGRLKLRWSPLDSLELGLSLQAARLRQTGDSFELSQASDSLLGVYQRFDPATRADIRDRRTHTDHADSGALIEGEDLVVSAQWDSDHGRWRLLGNLSAQDTRADFDLDVSPVPFLNFPSLEAYTQRSAEIRYDTTTSWGGYAAGLYLFRADLDLQVDINVFEQGAQASLTPLLGLPGELGELFGAFSALGLGFGQSRHRLLQRQETGSLFATADWDVNERLTLRADGRLNRETKRADQRIDHNGTTGPLLGQAIGEEEYELIASRGETDFSPRLSALYQWREGLSSYLTAAEGFKSGGFNNLAAVPERAEFDAEASRTVEAGLRWQGDSGLRAALQLFHTRFRNLQVAALDGTEFFVGNAARARTQGVELSARWVSPFGLIVTADLGYLHARYQRYRQAPTRADSDEDSQDLSGRVLQRAPRWSGSLQLDFLSRIGALPIAVGTVLEGTSHQFLNVDLDPIDAQPGYLRYNAYAALSDPSERFSLRLIGRNLSDAVVRREAADVALVGAHSVGLFPPRSVGLELGYRF